MSLQDQLQKLSLAERRMRGLRSRLDAGTRRRDAQSRKLDQLQQQLIELNDQVRHAQSAIAALETETAGMGQRVEQLREQMNSVDTNKQYQALLVEVNTLKVEKAKLEDQEIEKMTELEQLQARAAELTQRRDDQQALVDVSDREVAEAKSEVGDKLDEAVGEREEAAQQVPTEVLNTFSRLAEAHDGEAVVGIEEQDRKRMEYTCGGCYMEIPVERVNTLMTRPDQLVICPNCARILTIDSELRGSLSPAE